MSVLCCYMLSEDRGQGPEILLDCVRCQVSGWPAEVLRKGQEDRRWPNEAGRLESVNVEAKLLNKRIAITVSRESVSTFPAFLVLTNYFHNQGPSVLSDDRAGARRA